MKIRHRFFPLLAGVACVLMPAAASAQNTYINNFGVGGWYSDDTRSDLGVNLIGQNYTHAGLQGGAGSEADDAAISGFLGFTSDFAGAATSRFGMGALRLTGGRENPAKSAISMINTTEGFAAASQLQAPDFYATYRAFNAPDPTTRSAALRFGIQSSAWEASQAGFTATRTGESSWDLILVYNASNAVNDWTQHQVSATEGLWSLHFQSDNSYFGAQRPTEQKTLAEWAADATFGSLLFGEGAMITNVQLGLGSWQRNNDTYIDFLQSNLLNNGEAINFVDSSVQIESKTAESGQNEFTAETNQIIQLTSGGATDAQVSVANSGTSGEKTVVEVTQSAVVVVESLEVGEGGVLAGGGHITAEQGITIAEGGVHAPGFSPGVQVLDMADAAYTNTATLEVELGGRTGATGTLEARVGGEFDQLLVLGDVNLDGLTLEIKGYNGFAPEVGDLFQILYFDGVLQSDLEDIMLLVSGFGYPVEFELTLQTGGNFLGEAELNYLQLEVIAIPEPGTATLLIGGLALGYALRARRKGRR